MGRSRSRSKRRMLLLVHALNFSEMLEKQVPRSILRLLFLLQQTMADNEGQRAALDGLEIFSGEMAITLSMQALGYAMLPFEIQMHPMMDFLSAAGMCLALEQTMRLKPYSLLLP